MVAPRPITNWPPPVDIPVTESYETLDSQLNELKDSSGVQTLEAPPYSIEESKREKFSNKRDELQPNTCLTDEFSNYNNVVEKVQENSENQHTYISINSTNSDDNPIEEQDVEEEKSEKFEPQSAVKPNSINVSRNSKVSKESKVHPMTGDQILKEENKDFSRVVYVNQGKIRSNKGTLLSGLSK